MRTPMRQPQEAAGASLAKDLLRRTQEEVTRAKTARINAVRLAREHGLTLNQIGAEFGVTGDAVRKMLERAAGDQNRG